tara:strand:- start:13065 stop:13538 length:474 start_codon:yes stop_codon:yes gene_type:complete
VRIKLFCKLLNIAFINLLIIKVANGQQLMPQYLPIEGIWCINGGECINLEVADKEEEKFLGLMLRPPLNRLQGMYFLFKEPTFVKFWMYRTIQPLDIIFISKSHIIDIIKQVPICKEKPCEYYSINSKVDGVLEIKAGEVERLNIKIGDKFEYKSTK